ncbi:putative pumilio domain-containing protein [Zalerion maritima]|uniref:Pumilio homology domain family member 3 n=1 Tax=Zalerion maritima TaxID=339359 RepID=A0AAD5WTC5_9PEZI|nr:putative pumilio domain-containing protein [Zalerion maritima]
MTAPSEERPKVNMANRPSRFSNYTMGNGTTNEKKTSQPIQAPFAVTSASAWQSTIWAPNPIGSTFSSKKDNGSRGPNSTQYNPGSTNVRQTGLAGSQDVLHPVPTGSAILTAASEADPGNWPNRPGSWNAPDNPQTRPGSGDNSPNRVRDATGQPLNDISSASFFTASRSLGQPSNSLTNQPRPNGVSNGLSNGLANDLPRFSNLRYNSAVYNDNTDKDTKGTFGSIGAPSTTLGMDARPARENGFLGAAPGRSRDSSMPPSRHSEVDHPSYQLGDNAMNGFNTVFSSSHTPNPSQSLSQRPNLTNHSASFPSQVNNRAYNMNTAQIDEQELAARFARAATLQEPIDHQSSNGLGYSNSASHSFQFNPGSQPWNTSIAAEPKHYEVSYQTPSFADHPAPLFSQRGSGERGSPAGSQYRSPKTYTGTPPSAVDSWSRPASSRDPRIDLERSRVGHPASYLAPQAPFYPHYYAPNFPQYTAPQQFDPYSAHPGYRTQIPLGAYGLPMPPYIPPVAAPSVMRAPKDQDHAEGVRSMLLEEFRAGSKSNKKYELKDIYNHVVEFSGDQHGSRFIQAKLENANSDEKDQVFREIEPNAIQLMKDVFGNYVIQKFFEHGNQVQKKILAGVMKGKMVDLSCQMYSCRVVQKAMEHVLVEQQAELVAELQPDVVRIIKDQNGNHVIQKVIEVVPGTYARFIIDALRGSISQMASHSYGCRVVQRLMEYGSEADQESIMNEIHSCAQSLVTDQYGNYVTQHILVHGSLEDRHRMVSIVIPQLLTLSKHKFASNVVEKCIECSSDKDRQAILDQVYTKTSDGTSSLFLLVKDQYGNYVIQKFLKYLRGEERARFVEELQPCVHQMKKISTGRTINALDRLIQMATEGPSQNTPSPSERGGRRSLHIDSNSASHTPVLTREPNTPQSSDPPSTNVSAVGEATSEALKAQVNGTGPDGRVEVNDSQ